MNWVAPTHSATIVSRRPPINLFPKIYERCCIFGLAAYSLPGCPAVELETKSSMLLTSLTLDGCSWPIRTRKTESAELNLCAGRKAKTSTAYAAALNYLCLGVNLIGSHAWERAYELTFGLWYERAEAELLIGNFSEAEKFIAVLLKKPGQRSTKQPSIS